MRVFRRRFRQGRRFYSEFRVELTPAEMAVVADNRLLDFKIQQHSGAVIGKTLANAGVAKAFQSQIGRIKNRWSIALARTSGSVFYDFVLIYLRLIKGIAIALFRLFFGTRVRFKKLLTGAKFNAKRIEDLKEIEVFVFVSIAAIHQAIEYATAIDRDDVFHGHGYRGEIEGLTFAGAALMMDGDDGDVDKALDDEDDPEGDSHSDADADALSDA